MKIDYRSKISSRRSKKGWRGDRNQLKRKEQNWEKLEFEIVSLRKELERAMAQLNRNLKNEKSLEILDDIIKSQKPTFDRSDIGYKGGQHSKSSKKSYEEKKYVDVLKSSIKDESAKRRTGSQEYLQKLRMTWSGSPFHQGKLICPVKYPTPSRIFNFKFMHVCLLVVYSFCFVFDNFKVFARKEMQMQANCRNQNT